MTQNPRKKDIRLPDSGKVSEDSGWEGLQSSWPEVIESTQWLVFRKDPGFPPDSVTKSCGLRNWPKASALIDTRPTGLQKNKPVHESLGRIKTTKTGHPWPARDYNRIPVHLDFQKIFVFKEITFLLFQTHLTLLIPWVVFMWSYYKSCLWICVLD